jgi:hypothetical protein
MKKTIIIGVVLVALITTAFSQEINKSTTHEQDILTRKELRENRKEARKQKRLERKEARLADKEEEEKLAFNKRLRDSPNSTLVSVNEFNGNCEEAKQILEKYADNPFSIPYHQVHAALAKVRNCNLQASNEKEGNDKSEEKEKNYIQPEVKSMAVYEDGTDGKVLFGLISQKELDNMRQLSRWVIDEVVMDIAKNEPVSATIILLAADVSVDAFYRAASQNDPALVFAPMHLPGIQGAKDFVALIDNDSKILLEMEEAHQKVIAASKEALKDVENVAEEIASDLGDTAETAIKDAGELGQKAIDVARENPGAVVAPIVKGHEEAIKVLKKIFDW